MKTYRVSILGCGARGTKAALAYNEHPRTEVVSLCDLVSELRDTLGESIGVYARYESLDEMIRDTNPDIVAVSTGTEHHYELCMRALEHGVNIEVEKPIAVNLKQADDIVAKARDKKVRVAVHHQGMVGASMKAVEQAYSNGRIGDIKYIVGRGKGYYGGYGLMNIGTHILSNVFKLGGHCTSVRSSLMTGGHMSSVEDVVTSPSGMGTIVGEDITANLQLEGSVMATLLQHRFPEISKIGQTIDVYGTEGRIFFQGNDSTWLLPNPNSLKARGQNNWEKLNSVYAEHYHPSGNADANDFWFVDEYVRALDEERDHECNGNEALHVLEVIMGIFEAASNGREIRIPQSNRDHPLLRWRVEHGLGNPKPMPRSYKDWLAVEDRRIDQKRSL